MQKELSAKELDYLLFGLHPELADELKDLDLSELKPVLANHLKQRLQLDTLFDDVDYQVDLGHGIVQLWIRDWENLNGRLFVMARQHPENKYLIQLKASSSDLLDRQHVPLTVPMVGLRKLLDKASDDTLGIECPSFMLSPVYAGQPLPRAMFISWPQDLMNYLQWPMVIRRLSGFYNPDDLKPMTSLTFVMDLAWLVNQKFDQSALSHIKSRANMATTGMSVSIWLMNSAFPDVPAIDIMHTSLTMSQIVAWLTKDQQPKLKKGSILSDVMGLDWSQVEAYRDYQARMQEVTDGRFVELPDGLQVSMPSVPADKADADDENAIDVPLAAQEPAVQDGADEEDADLAISGVQLDASQSGDSLASQAPASESLTDSDMASAATSSSESLIVDSMVTATDELPNLNLLASDSGTADLNGESLVASSVAADSKSQPSSSSSVSSEVASSSVVSQSVDDKSLDLLQRDADETMYSEAPSMTEDERGWDAVNEDPDMHDYVSGESPASVIHRHMLASRQPDFRVHVTHVQPDKKSKSDD